MRKLKNFLKRGDGTESGEGGTFPGAAPEVLMDNQALEMDGENVPSAPGGAKECPRQSWHSWHSWQSRPLLRLFLLALLAGTVTTGIGVLALALALRGHPPPAPPAPVDIKFQFLYHLGQSEVHRYEGGEVQWARFRRDARAYGSEAERAFGASLHARRAQLSLGTLRIRPRGLRVPHWHVNANEHGYLAQGSAWVGVVSPDGSEVTTYNVSEGQAVFFPRNSVHWIRNVGSRDCLFLLFYSTHEELLTLEVGDAFFGTPQDVLDRTLRLEGGLKFIRTFQKPGKDQTVNLPSPNLERLLRNVPYGQSPERQVWKFFYDLKGSREFPFPGGVFQWARFRRNGTGLSLRENIYSQSLHQQEQALTLALLRISPGSLGQPHFHSNANEMGIVLGGCGTAGIVLPGGTSSTFPVGTGDVVFFPAGSQHFLQSRCQAQLALLLAYSTSTQLETLRMSRYWHGTSWHVLAQLFNHSLAVPTGSLRVPTPRE